MQTSIKLQELFTYSLIPLGITVLLIIILTCYLFFSRYEKNLKIEENKVEKFPKRNEKNLLAIKRKYIKQLNLIENKYKNGTIELREAYQSISEAIRLFVFEITEIKTQNYSLIEIKKLNMPVLYELIEEYYEPEFASKSIGDFETSINKARRVINEWN